MRRTDIARVMLLAALTWSAASNAQLDLAGIRMAEPSPELPGDRALSCTQLANEMGEIMRKRGMKRGMASARNKICASRKTLDAQGDERQKMLNAQRPTLTAAAAVGGPVANAALQKTQAEEAALEARQRPERDRAVTGISSGVGDMMGVMNDPRLMRLSILAQEQRCEQTMAPKETPPAAEGDGCEGDAEVTGRPGAPGVAADPFVQRGATPAKPAASDPFAK
jgi:hypothetical protein